MSNDVWIALKRSLNRASTATIHIQTTLLLVVIYILFSPWFWMIGIMKRKGLIHNGWRTWTMHTDAVDDVLRQY